MDTGDDDIVRVQIFLSNLGFYRGTPNGIAGPATREAIADYREARGLRPPCVAGPVTMATLFSPAGEFGT